jgi:hypothetical protein
MPYKSSKFIVIIKILKLGLMVDSTQDSDHSEKLYFL